MREFLLPLGTALMLAACTGKSDDDLSSDTAQLELEKGGSLGVKPGLWEIRFTATQVNAGKLPKSVIEKFDGKRTDGVVKRSCLTAEQAKKPTAEFFSAAKDAKCTFSKIERSGENIAIEMQCSPGEQMPIESKMSGRFNSENYSLVTQQKVNVRPLGAIVVDGTVEGKRVGDCAG